MTRRRWAGSAAAAAWVVVSASGAAAQVVRVTPTLAAGDTFTLVVTRTRETIGVAAPPASRTSTVDVRVESASATGHVLLWMPVAAEPRPDDPPTVRAAAAALKGLQIRLRLDAQGAYAGVMNEEQVLPQLRAALAPIVTAALDAAAPAQRAALEATMTRMTTPAVLLDAAVRDAQLYFALNGTALAPGASTTRETEVPSPFDGVQVRAQTAVTLVSAERDSAVWTMTTTYDGSVTLPGAERATTVAFTDTGRYVLDRPSGLMREVAVERRHGVGERIRVDRWEIRRAESR